MREFPVFSAPDVQLRILKAVSCQGQSTRQALADELGCSLLTASKAVASLLDKGVMMVDGTVSSPVGRRKSILKINPRYRMSVCADIGYGGIKIALVDLCGEVVRKVFLPPLGNPVSDGVPYEAMLRVMGQMIGEAGSERLLGVGVGISGMVGFEEGRVLFCPNIKGFDDRLLADEMERILGLPVLLDTSARCMAAGEYRFGAGRGIGNQVCLSLGSGSIAAGILLDGRLYRGAEGYAGEIGHTCVRPGRNALRCSCGGFDCLELYATLQMLSANIRSALERFDGYSAAKRALAGAEMTVGRLREVLSTGDPIVMDCYHQAVDDIATVLVGVVNLFAPEAVVVGGGLTACFPEVVGELERKVRSACLTPLRSSIRLVPSLLGEETALRGAAAMLIGRYFGEE